jgi:enoyl-CoA hydratase/carnithine racemase
MAERVTIRTEDGVADVRLNRPDKMNALDPAMFRALVEAGESLARDRSVRAVVLSGEGRAFCAGLDFGSFQAMTGPRSERPTEPLLGTEARAAGALGAAPESPANPAQRAAWVWQEVPVPVIAAVHGPAFGGGLQVALGADLRYVAPDAQLSVMEIKWGLVPDMAGTQLLRHLVRLDVAKELTFSGRVLSGTEAAALGLATRVSDRPRDDALDTAREIARRSPEAIRAAKRLLNGSVATDLRAGLALEAELQRALIGTRNQIEAVRSNLEKRPARFEDPA